MIAFFLFYNHSAGIQSRLAFSKEFLHCSVIVCNDSEYIHTTFGGDGIVNRLIFPKGWKQLARLYPALVPTLSALVIVEIDKRHIKKWSPLWVKSCNEVCRYVSGIQIGFTFNPRHLYAKLIKYDSKLNYKILHAWTREQNPISTRRLRNGDFQWRRCC